MKPYVWVAIATLRLFERLFGKNHPNTVQAKAGLIATYKHQGNGLEQQLLRENHSPSAGAPFVNDGQKMVAKTTVIDVEEGRIQCTEGPLPPGEINPSVPVSSC